MWQVVAYVLFVWCVRSPSLLVSGCDQHAVVSLLVDPRPGVAGPVLNIHVAEPPDSFDTQIVAASRRNRFGQLVESEELSTMDQNAFASVGAARLMSLTNIANISELLMQAN